MDALEFFNFLKTTPVQDLKKLNLNSVKHLFASEAHYERFCELHDYIMGDFRVHKKTTYSYVVFYVYPDDDVYVVIYDPELNTLYCDIIHEVFYRTFNKIHSDWDVLKYLYEVPEGFIRVQGDLYIQILETGTLRSILLQTLKQLLDKLFEPYYRTAFTSTARLLHALASYPESRCMFKFPRFNDLFLPSLSKQLSKQLESIGDPLVRKFLSELDNAIDKVNDSLHEFSWYLFWGGTPKLTKLKNLILGYLNRSNFYTEAVDRIINLIQLYDIPAPHDTIHKLPTLYKVLDFKEQKFILEILSNLHWLVKRLQKLYEVVLNVKTNDLLTYLIPQLKVHKLRFVRAEGNPHLVQFIGARVGTVYLVISDIVIKHKEHGTVVVPVNGYNPLYVSSGLYKDLDSLSPDKVPAALVRFQLV